MKTYKTPRITVKVLDVELMQMATSSPNTQSLNVDYEKTIKPSEARSKQDYGLYDDEDDIFIRTQVNTGVVE